MEAPLTAHGALSVSELDKTEPAAITKGSKSYLFYGTFGTGKSTFALEHPAERKFIIDVDDKIREMENVQHLFKGVTIWRQTELLTPKGIVMPTVDPQRKDPKKGFISGEAPKGYRRQEEVTNELLALAYKCREKNEPFPYGCAIWDSGTRTVDHLIQAILYQHQMGSMTETLWGVFAQAMKQYMNGFLRLRDAGCDCIVIFHERQGKKKDREGAIIEEFIRPSCPGQVGLDMGQMFSEVYYFQGRRGDGKYVIQTSGDAVLPARTTKGLDFKQVLDPKRIYG